MDEPIFDDPYAEYDRQQTAARAQAEMAQGHPTDMGYQMYPVGGMAAAYPGAPEGASPDVSYQMTVAGAPSGWARTQVAGLPAWGWGLIAAGLGVGGYFYLKSRGNVTPNPDSEEGDGAGDGKSTWNPSRSKFATRLERWLKKNGSDGVTVYSDADDAAKVPKNPSPLITMKTRRGAKLDDEALAKMTRREGLYPVRNPDGTVGLYPVDGSKRGKEWEGYIDALRDEGQQV